MNYLYVIVDTLPNTVWVGIVCLVLGAWFTLCRMIEYHAVKKELRRAIAPVFKNPKGTFFDVVLLPLKIISFGEAALKLRHRMGTTKERDYVYRRAVNSLQSSAVMEWLIPLNSIPVHRVTGIQRILAMFWPAIW